MASRPSREPRVRAQVRRRQSNAGSKPEKEVESGVPLCRDAFRHRASSSGMMKWVVSASILMSAGPSPRRKKRKIWISRRRAPEEKEFIEEARAQEGPQYAQEHEGLVNRPTENTIRRRAPSTASSPPRSARSAPCSARRRTAVGPRHHAHRGRRPIRRQGRARPLREGPERRQDPLSRLRCYN